MTKYNLEEFKQWLEEKPERKTHLCAWTSFLKEWTDDSTLWSQVFSKEITAASKDYCRLASLYREIVQQWIQEREREREREQKEEGGDNMLETTQLCLYCQENSRRAIIHGMDRKEQNTCSEECYSKLKADKAFWNFLDKLFVLEDDLIEANLAIETKTHELTTKNKNIEELKTNLANTESISEEHYDQLQATQTQLTTEQNKTQAFQKKLATLQTEKTNLQKTNQALTILANSRQEQLTQEKQALIQLAQKKIKNQKEARELLKQLETKWTKEKGELTEELTQAKQTNENLTQTTENLTQRILALEADKQDLIKQNTNQKTKEKTLLHKEIQLIKEALYD